MIRKEIRLRRLRTSAHIRDAIQDHPLHKEQFIYPLFVVPEIDEPEPIPSMPGIFHHSPDSVMNEVEAALDLGITKFLLFGSSTHKSTWGREASDEHGVVPTALTNLKQSFGKRVTLFADVCLCPYTDHGHCGIPDENGNIQNDPSLPHLAEAAVSYAEHGADWVAPSDMMDHRIGVIRSALDEHGLSTTGILSYSVKFASSYYGPFRDAVDSAPRFGDRRTYQMDFRDSRQAIREVQLDEEEGADAVMVKPALAYLDIISKVREYTDLPVAAYNVSGEYSLVKFGAKAGIVEEQALTMENLAAIARAGADLIITYHAREVLEKGWL